MKVEHLREFVTDEEIISAQGAIPKGRSKEFYLGFKTAIAIISGLVGACDKITITKKLAAILVNLEKELNR